MKNRTLPILLLGSILLIAGTGNLLAQAPDHGDYGRAVEAVSKFLNLTEDQLTDFVTILQENHEAIKSIEGERKILARELDELLDSGVYDLDEVGAYTEEIHALGHMIRDIRAAMKESLFLILDDEQEHKSQAVRRAAILQPVVKAYKVLVILPAVVPFPTPPEDNVE
jgi:Spy/CpxP family protein refolding chaperone